ncbi:MAG: DEAD/DEAH box helicase [Butyricimonas faecihominis]
MEPISVYQPGLLVSTFHGTLLQPITQLKDKSCQNQLKRLLSPFLLRRTRNAVLDELPPKTEIIRDVELSEAEMAQYELLRREAEMTLADATNGDQLKIIAEITRLRLAACNINLVNKAFTTQASKVETFLNIVNKLKANNHRALVFSQFTSHLALIRQALDQTGISYLYLDGSTPIRQREQLVAQFQEGTSLLFLISLKAGGLGLNLTAADFVIHMDPWWNPAVEDQASNRTYRIGQTRPVTIYRLIAKGTIEEIIRLHHTKKISPLLARRYGSFRTS